LDHNIERREAIKGREKQCNLQRGTLRRVGQTHESPLTLEKEEKRSSRFYLRPAIPNDRENLKAGGENSKTRRKKKKARAKNISQSLDPFRQQKEKSRTYKIPEMDNANTSKKSD